MNKKIAKSVLSIFFMLTFLTNLIFAQPIEINSLRKLAADESKTVVNRRGFLGAIGAAIGGAAVLSTVESAAQQRGQIRTVGQSLKETFGRIKEKNGRVSSYSWNVAELTPENVRTLGQAGFNEIIIDGYRLLPGNRNPVFNMGTFKDGLIEAANQGIKIKFTMGDPSWAYGGAPAAIQLTKALCKLLSNMKNFLSQSKNPNDRKAADVIEGLVIDIEPYGDPGWKSEGRVHDLSGYVRVHNELEEIAKASGLTYERAEAFWFGQKRLEDGSELRNYQPIKTGRLYLMSYKNTGAGTMAVASDQGRKHEHILGFDMATGGGTGFQGNLQNLPGAIGEAANRSLQQRDTFRGLFVHSDTLSELVREIKKWNRAPVEGQQEPEAETGEPKEPGRPGVGKGSISAQVISSSGDITRFKIRVVLPAGVSRQNVRLVAVKKTDLWYSQTNVAIPPNGVVVIPITKRRSTGQVKFIVVDTTKLDVIPEQMGSLNVLRKAAILETTEDFQAQVPSYPIPYSPLHLRPSPITPLKLEPWRIASLADPFEQELSSTGEGPALAASVAVAATKLENRKLTRRGFLKTTAVGRTAVGVLAVASAVTGADPQQGKSSLENTLTTARPMLEEAMVLGTLGAVAVQQVHIGQSI